MPDLLLELFSEEIPARMQARAADDLKRLVTNGLVEAGLTYAAAAAFSTPRRLTLTIEGMLAESPTQREERKGPRVDAPEKALEGFLRATGLTRDRLEARDDKKGQVWFATIEKPGRPAPEIVAEVVTATVRSFPWPKSMRWGAGSLRWVRPLHSILCITYDEGGAQVVPFEIDGIAAGDSTRGHRFMAPDGFAVMSFDDYAARLKRAKVVLNPQERADHIWADATNAAFAQGLEAVEDRGLLAEVAGLVEWPVVLMGAIGADFLDLPPEVLQTSMREHQKFFSVRNPKSGRIEKFVTVANRETADDGATILAGNGRVLAARLADAKFFWENDLRVAQAGMGEWLDKLGAVTFHNKLGSQADRIARIAALAREIAPQVGADADLASEMVYEFPELQGVMARYYAEKAGLGEDIARAAQEHYQPLGPSDAVPTAPVSVAVALADKIDTLTGFWAIDEKPTGSKDPFALRRAALGVIRLVLENGLRVGLEQVFAASRQDADSADLLAFFHDRLKVYLRDRGIRHDVIDASLAMPGNDDLSLLVKRAEALSDLLKSDDGENLLQGFKRANNILTQAEEKDGVEYSFGADPKLAETEEERALFAALDAARARIEPAMRAEDFATAMQAMASLRAPIDAFFETVQINAESQILRRNRLNLLHSIRAICSDVADLNRIEG
ncbi:glycine--tRNA ligase subunit beta [Brevirhabdus sp.]|uniref:glycine--tRNA ligase subunit beta n=1 Tax=Brevirhabdus sp. TaxID=2004514 RepID=UPI004057E8C6